MSFKNIAMPKYCLYIYYGTSFKACDYVDVPTKAFI